MGIIREGGFPKEPKQQKPPTVQLSYSDRHLVAVKKNCEEVRIYSVARVVRCWPL